MSLAPTFNFRETLSRQTAMTGADRNRDRYMSSAPARIKTRSERVVKGVDDFVFFLERLDALALQLSKKAAIFGKLDFNVDLPPAPKPPPPPPAAGDPATEKIPESDNGYEKEQEFIKVRVAKFRASVGRVVGMSRKISMMAARRNFQPPSIKGSQGMFSEYARVLGGVNSVVRYQQDSYAAWFDNMKEEEDQRGSDSLRKEQQTNVVLDILFSRWPYPKVHTLTSMMPGKIDGAESKRFFLSIASDMFGIDPFKKSSALQKLNTVKQVNRVVAFRKSSQLAAENYSLRQSRMIQTSLGKSTSNLSKAFVQQGKFIPSAYSTLRTGVGMVAKTASSTATSLYDIFSITSRTIRGILPGTMETMRSLKGAAGEIISGRTPTVRDVERARNMTVSTRVPTAATSASVGVVRSATGKYMTAEEFKRLPASVKTSIVSRIGHPFKEGVTNIPKMPNELSSKVGILNKKASESSYSRMDRNVIKKTNTWIDTNVSKSVFPVKTVSAETVKTLSELPVASTKPILAKSAGAARFAQLRKMVGTYKLFGKFAKIPYLSIFIEAVMNFPEMITILTDPRKSSQQKFMAVLDYMKHIAIGAAVGIVVDILLQTVIIPLFLFLIANPLVLFALVVAAAAVIISYLVYRNMTKERKVAAGTDAKIRKYWNMGDERVVKTTPVTPSTPPAASTTSKPAPAAKTKTPQGKVYRVVDSTSKVSQSTPSSDVFNQATSIVQQNTSRLSAMTDAVYQDFKTWKEANAKAQTQEALA